MSAYGIGTLPSASWRGVRGRENGLLRAAQPTTITPLKDSIDASTQRAAREFFSPAFRVEASGYGIAPRANDGSVVSVIGAQGFRGLDGMMVGFKAGTAAPECTYEAVRGLENQLKMRLPYVSAGIRVTCEAILAQVATTSGFFGRRLGNMTDCERIGLLQQALSAAINDIRAQEGLAPKDASGKVVTATGTRAPSPDTVQLSKDISPQEVRLDSIPDAGFLPMVFPNSWANTTRIAVTAGVGVLVLAAIGAPVMRLIK